LLPNWHCIKFTDLHAIDCLRVAVLPKTSSRKHQKNTSSASGMFLHLCVFQQPVYDKCAEQFTTLLIQTVKKPRSISKLFRKYHIITLFILYNPVALSSPFRLKWRRFYLKTAGYFKQWGFLTCFKFLDIMLCVFVLHNNILKFATTWDDQTLHCVQAVLVFLYI
jgi:hypothetical protein